MNAAAKQFKVSQTWCSTAPECFGMAPVWMDICADHKITAYACFLATYNA